MIRNFSGKKIMKERSIATLSLDGGCLCFNFINTVHSRMQKPAYEYINSYAELLQWAKKAGALPREQLASLEKLSFHGAAQAEALLNYFRETREIMYHFFSAVAAQRDPGREICLLFNQSVKEAMQHLQFNASHFPVALEWRAAGSDSREPVWAALKSARDILQSEDQQRIKECEACGWLFLDQTKNNRKRWCNPAVCGSADKAKRYYQRKKQAQSPT